MILQLLQVGAAGSRFETYCRFNVLMVWISASFDPKTLYCSSWRRGGGKVNGGWQFTPPHLYFPKHIIDELNSMIISSNSIKQSHQQLYLMFIEWIRNRKWNVCKTMPYYMLLSRYREENHILSCTGKCCFCNQLRSNMHLPSGLAWYRKRFDLKARFITTAAAYQSGY